MEKYGILIIEDDESQRNQLARIVHKEGFEVMTAENGRIGLEIFERDHPDIILTDLRMPEIDGMEVMHRIKRSTPHVQVILVTAFGDSDTVITALREGVLDYLKKPLDLELLSIVLGKAKEKVAEYKKTVPCPSLLIAEDEESARIGLRKMLEKEGWVIFEARDGEEAIAVFGRTKIDIVLLDIQMPKKGGLQALQEMREISDDFEVIVFTGYGDESTVVQAMRGGAINFIKKPVDLDQLTLLVEKAFEKLKISRSLKYRTHELELTDEVIVDLIAKQHNRA